MRISDWSSDVCSSDLLLTLPRPSVETGIGLTACPASGAAQAASIMTPSTGTSDSSCLNAVLRSIPARATRQADVDQRHEDSRQPRSEEHTSELQSLMRISYAVFCLKKKKVDEDKNRDNRHNGTQDRLRGARQHT